MTVLKGLLLCRQYLMDNSFLLSIYYTNSMKMVLPLLFTTAQPFLVVMQEVGKAISENTFLIMIGWKRLSKCLRMNFSIQVFTRIYGFSTKTNRQTEKIKLSLSMPVIYSNH